MNGMESLCSLVPAPPDWTVDWEQIEATKLGEYFFPMRSTPQDAEYHGEGDVLNHTKLVCEQLCKLSAYRQLSDNQRQIMFVAALLHDVGKITCNRKEDGRIVSTHHGPVGAREARRRLWLDFGLCGTPEAQRFRETVCTLIRYHTTPVHAIDNADSPRRLRAIAAQGELLPDFSLHLLCLLAEADVLGRMCADQTELLERVSLCEELAREAGCLDGPYPFPTEHTRFSYLSGKKIAPNQPLYDDTWGPVILLSGLPGTGKDTWIRENCPELPMISLDQIREELEAPSTANQNLVVDLARERAREYLREKQSFVWNATSLSPAIRQNQLNLFHDYHASVKIVYLETEWNELLQRNRGRDAVVPEDRILRMQERMTLPEIREAERVAWMCI